MAKRTTTIDWPRIQIEYCANEDSIREIADRHEISDTAIRKRAKVEKWERVVRTPNRCEPMRSPPPPPRSDPADPVTTASVAEDGRALGARHQRHQFAAKQHGVAPPRPRIEFQRLPHPIGNDPLVP